MIYTFAEEIPCSYCGNAERTILVAERPEGLRPEGLRPEGLRPEGLRPEGLRPEGLRPEGLRPEGQMPETGVCEACAVDLYWAWKKLLADAAPTSRAPADRVSRVKVLIARRRTSRSGVLEPAEISSSYEMLMVSMPDGTLDLPTADVGPGEPEVEAAKKALAAVGIITWPAFLDSLYAAHVPRGSLCRVYLARIYAMPGAQPEVAPPQWRAWPLGQHVPAMAGFYLALKDVWPLVLRAPRSPTVSEICVGLRRGALEYIKMQQQIREKVPNIDTSMAEYLRRGMTEDECLAEKALRKGEDLAVLAQATVAPAANASGGKRPVFDAEEISETDEEFDPTSDGDASVAGSTDVTMREGMTEIEDEDVE